MTGSMSPEGLLELAIGEHRVSCWSCGRSDRDKTMGVTVDGDGAVYHCFRCAVAGREHPDRPSIERPRPARMSTTVQKLEWSATAEAIWHRTVPLQATLGATYLEHRGCVMPPGEGDLRFLASVGEYPPTLCALVSDAVSGRPMTLHFTRLAGNGRGKAGTDRDKSLLSGHRKGGGVIRLWPNESVTTGLCIAEGVETALAAAHAYTPVWACVDAGNLEHLPVLAGIECITIIADHDDTGLQAAATCGQRWADAGRDVSIVTPADAGTDLADLAVAS